MSTKLLKFLIFLLPALRVAAANAVDDPCTNLLALINRPTIADSACSVKPGDVLVEAGFQYASLYPQKGEAMSFPDASVRLGLPYGNEINISANYLHALPKDVPEVNGVTATVLGYKHQFPVAKKWIYAAESIFTLPSGSKNFGSHALGATINGLVTYFVTKTLSLETSVGVSSLTTSSDLGGERYNSFNPDVVINWEPIKKLQFYWEIYGQTKTGPELPDGFNTHGGVQYLVTENIEVDLGYGHRINGELGGFTQYVGFGGGILF